MFDYPEGVIVEYTEDLKNSCSYYLRKHQLFNIFEDSPSLPPKDAELFHRHVGWLLPASKRARPNIQVYVAFLRNQVNSPTEKDYRKLGRVISYLEETVHIPLVISADNSGTLIWNIDTPFAVHPDYKSHTGVYLIIGHGSLLSLLSKQNINTKSLTEAELVGVDGTMIFVMWMKYFLESQVRYINVNPPLKPLQPNVRIEQDKRSTIQLERNREKSSSLRSKHIAVRYFYITDQIKAGDLNRVIYNQLKRWKAIIIQRYFKETGSTPIVKHSWVRLDWRIHVL